jgi:hypothetical protein
MNRLTIVFSGLLGVPVTASAAQEPSRSIDLGVSPTHLFPQLSLREFHLPKLMINVHRSAGCYGFPVERWR